MAHHGASELAIMIQGNWKDGRMPAKYVRDRKAIPIAYLPSLAKDLRSGWRPSGPAPATPRENEVAEPAEEISEVEMSDMEEDEVARPCFWGAAEASIAHARDLRFHVADAKDPARLACGRLA